jgi:hypothetical protein
VATGSSPPAPLMPSSLSPSAQGFARWFDMHRLRVTVRWRDAVL